MGPGVGGRARDGHAVYDMVRRPMNGT